VIGCYAAPVISGRWTHLDALPGAQLEFIVDTVLRGVAP